MIDGNSGMQPKSVERDLGCQKLDNGCWLFRPELGTIPTPITGVQQWIRIEKGGIAIALEKNAGLDNACNWLFSIFFF